MNASETNVDPTGRPPVSIRIIGTHAADVQAGTSSDPFDLKLKKDFISQLQALEEQADGLAAGIRGQTGLEACRSDATLNARTCVLSVDISVDPDVELRDAQIVARAVNNSLVKGLTDDDACALSKGASQIVNQYSLSILKKQGGGDVTFPTATCINQSEVARVEGQFLPPPNLSNPQPERIEPCPGWIVGFDRLKHCAFVKVTLPGTKKPKKVTAYFGDEKLEQECAEIASNPKNGPVVAMTVTRDPAGSRRYDLLSIE
jgi:hypothetical protein